MKAAYLVQTRHDAPTTFKKVFSNRHTTAYMGYSKNWNIVAYKFVTDCKRVIQVARIVGFFSGPEAYDTDSVELKYSDKTIRVFLSKNGDVIVTLPKGAQIKEQNNEG